MEREDATVELRKSPWPLWRAAIEGQANTSSILRLLMPSWRGWLRAIFNLCYQALQHEDIMLLCRYALMATLNFTALCLLTP